MHWRYSEFSVTHQIGIMVYEQKPVYYLGLLVSRMSPFSTEMLSHLFRISVIFVNKPSNIYPLNCGLWRFSKIALLFIFHREKPMVLFYCSLVALH